MPYGPESAQFEALLRQRAVATDPDAVDREIAARHEQVCAVLVLDAAGFTVSVRDRGIIAHLTRIVALRDWIRPLFREHRALCHWPVADNMTALFGSMRDALDCALAVRVGTCGAGDDGGPAGLLPVSLAIGWGPLLRVGTEDAWGHEVNLAHKLGEDTAAPGEILLTESAWSQAAALGMGLEGDARTVSHGGVTIRYWRVRRDQGS